MTNISVLVLSCDKYSDLWDGFFSLYFKNFDFKCKVYLANNKLKYNFRDYSINLLNCGEDKNWSNHLLNALNLIEDDYIFIILEDLYILDYVEKSKIAKLFNFAINNKVQHLKYLAFPIGDIPLNNGYFKYSPGMPYSVSVCGIWNKKYLQSLLLDGESAWEFEINGSYRSKYSNKNFMSPAQPILKCLNMVEKGYWVKSNVKKIQNQGIYINLKTRKVKNNISYKIINFYFDFVINFIPFKYRIKIIDILKKLTITY